MKQHLNIVWLKRDIRTQDHAPLQAAEHAGVPYLIIYLFEPSLLERQDTSLRHHQFNYHSLLDFNNTLVTFNREAILLQEEAVTVFDYLLKTYEVNTVFSYQESGVMQTWQRDKEVAELLQTNKVKWVEFQRDGVVRGIQNREGWDKQWYHTMNQPIIRNSYSYNRLEHFENPYPLGTDFILKLSRYDKAFQPAGERNAWKYLKSFAEDRGKKYHLHISKPKESRLSCGRISPYLAWGNMSIKQAVQFIKHHENYISNKRAFNGLLTRLKWHCHFIQKFEMECTYETECVNKGYEELERPKNEAFIQAWKEGKTGYPLVDACMRCVQQTGWINFRMRAMVVSLLCHHLDQNWRHGVYHLAQLFLDYEPGIHYTQFQMQAGTTGVNTVRIYNPVKQAYDHDPEAVFIKEWVPELRNLPTPFALEPWTITELDEQLNGFNLPKHYRQPLVDLGEAGKKARQKIWRHRSNATVKSERERILQKHTRNN